MSKVILAAIGVAVLGAPLYAQDASVEERTILVQPERSSFASNLQHELTRELNRIPYPTSYRQSGVVKVRFIANGEGRAEQISLYEDSGSNRMNNTAMRVVERINNLGPATAYGGDQAVLLNIVFATSEREAERLVDRVRAENAALIASGELSPEVLAVTMTSSVPS